MLRGEKKKTHIWIWSIILLICLGGIAISMLRSEERYHEKAVMAERYLESGDYQQAIKTYKKIMSMNPDNKELLSIGLAEAYLGIHEYDNALDVLRKSYKIYNSDKLRQKIEEVILRKTDYNFEQIIARADTYFYNGEYEKAIPEYEKAKTIKSKEIISYQRIADAYIAMNQYDLAQKQAMDGMAITNNTQLQGALDRIDAHLLEDEYYNLLKSATEYVAQENYDEAIEIYQQAIKLLPKYEQAYGDLSDLYVNLKLYSKSVYVLKNALVRMQSDLLTEKLEHVLELIEIDKETKKLLELLYRAVMEGDVESIIKYIECELYKGYIQRDEVIYFVYKGDQSLNTGSTLIIENGSFYAGYMEQGLKKGTGSLFLYEDTEVMRRWYLYKGDWSNNLPNGMGTTKDYYLDKTEEIQTELLTVSEGIFAYGIEHSNFKRIFYENHIEVGRIHYQAKNGYPQALLDNNNKPIRIDNKQAIAYWIRDGVETDQYYTVDIGTLWDVKMSYEEKTD